MSHWDSSISRVGMAIQYAKPLAGFPGWGSHFLANRVGAGAGFGSQGMGAAGLPAPNWLGRSPGGNEVHSREFLHAMTRYPRFNNQAWRYACEIEIPDIAVAFYCTAFVSGLALRSHRGIDAGGRAAKVTIEEIRVTFTDGGQQVIHAGAVLFNINGWANVWGTNTWNWTDGWWLGNRPIRRVRFSLRLDMGSEGYHDIGDGSPGWDWGPPGVVGHPAMGAGYVYNDPAPGAASGFLDRERVYLVKNNPGYVQAIAPSSSVAKSGLRELIGSSGGGGYRSATAYNLW